MSEETLEEYVRQYISQQDSSEISFAWQGGEPTLLGLKFFEKAVEFQHRYAHGKTITNAFQTNGTLLDDAWCGFFKENQFLVGVSIDGPPKLHDALRVNKRGKGTYPQVIRGIRLLQKHDVEFNTLTTVNRVNGSHPLEVYRFLKRIGSRYLQFIPIVERLPDKEAKSLGLDLAMPPRVDEEGSVKLSVTDWSVLPSQYGDFLCTIFDEWVANDVGSVFVQMFDVTLGNEMGWGSSLCLFSETCGGALAMEHNGDVYSCDHYVYPQYKLGNILNTSLGEMVHSDFQKEFGENKKTTLPKYCLECDVRYLCHGECPKKRFIRTPDGEPGLNYLCAAYKKFFHHSSAAMREMAALLRAGRPAADVMRSRKRF